MLYTFSQASYDVKELCQHFQHVTKKDALLLWQDGVLLPLKYPILFNQLNVPCFILEQDLDARNIKTLIAKNKYLTMISLPEFIQVTETYFPQFAL